MLYVSFSISMLKDIKKLNFDIKIKKIVELVNLKFNDFI